MLLFVIAIMQFGCSKLQQHSVAITNEQVTTASQNTNSTTELSCGVWKCPSDSELLIKVDCYFEEIPCESILSDIDVIKDELRIKTPTKPISEELKNAMLNTAFGHQNLGNEVVHSIVDKSKPSTILYSTTLKKIKTLNGYSEFSKLGDPKLMVSEKSLIEYAKTRSLASRKQVLKEAYDQLDIKSILKSK